MAGLYGHIAPSIFNMNNNLSNSSNSEDVLLNMQCNANSTITIKLPKDIHSYRVEAINDLYTYKEIGSMQIHFNLTQILYNMEYCDGAGDTNNLEQKLSFNEIPITADENSINVEMSNANLFPVNVKIFN